MFDIQGYYNCISAVFILCVVQENIPLKHKQVQMKVLRILRYTLHPQGVHGNLAWQTLNMLLLDLLNYTGRN